MLQGHINAFFLEVAELNGSDRGKIGIGDEVGDSDFHYGTPRREHGFEEMCTRMIDRPASVCWLPAAYEFFTRLEVAAGHSLFCLVRVLFRPIGQGVTMPRVR